ncbi:hypothetical protein F4781DRAFT_430777 [Annulohypoxylon bovei var. microspora]|nr:hypothetical protein F4781DRAFT_430777 [Annulohypoxylon bovei var. microspora]
MSWDVLAQLPSLPLEEQEDILNGPALSPPANIVPNLDNPPNGNTLALVVITFCLSIVILAVLLRAYVKIFVVHKLFLEDVLVFAMITTYDYCCYRVLFNVGFFVHQWDVRVRDVSEVLYVGNMGSSFYEVAISTLKVAILLEWNKIFAPNRSPRSFYWTCRILLWVTVLYYIITVIASNIVCFPTPGFWKKSGPSSCINKGVAEAISATLNLVSHILILALPQGVIWQLHMTNKKKIGVCLVFAIGILAVISGVCRLVATTRYFTSKDTIFVESQVYLWCVVELMFVVLVFCVPTIPRSFGEGTHVSKIIVVLRSWSRLFIRRSGTNKDSTQVYTENELSASRSTYQGVGAPGNLPLKNLENWNGNWNAQVFHSTEQLQKSHNNPSIARKELFPLPTETCEERCSAVATVDDRDFMSSWARQIP